MRYRKKPVIVEAVQITDEWFEKEHTNPLHPVTKDRDIIIDPIKCCVEVATPKEIMVGYAGDWIIIGAKGGKLVCKPDIFKKTFEPFGKRAMLRLLTVYNDFGVDVLERLQYWNEDLGRWLDVPDVPHVRRSISEEEEYTTKHPDT